MINLFIFQFLQRHEEKENWEWNNMSFEPSSDSEPWINVEQWYFEPPVFWFSFT